VAASGREREVDVQVNTADARVADLVAALELAPGIPGVWVDGEYVDGALALDRAGIHEGGRISDAPRSHPLEPGIVELRVVAGDDAGLVVPLRAASYVVGRDDACDIKLAARTVSRKHCRLTVTPDGAVTIETNPEAGPTIVDDTRVASPLLLAPD